MKEGLLEEAIGENRDAVEALLSRGPDLVYSSVDIRDSGSRACPVDVNVFPAGFNNLESLDEASRLFGRFLEREHPGTGRVGILPEAHTKNRYYFDNLISLREAVRGAGVECEVVTRSESLLDSAFEGQELGKIRYRPVEEFGPDFLLLNNDLSNGPVEAGCPVEPPQGMGWWSRSKSEFFRFFREECEAFADAVGVEPWRFFPETRSVEGVDFRGDLGELAEVVEEVLHVAEERSGEAVAFLKDDRGTYGQGTTVVRSGDEVRKMSSRQRKSMAVGKGGHEVDSVLVQEGIPTRFRVEGSAAEPVQYLVDGDSAGYFWRCRGESDLSVLNKPGQSFQGPCSIVGGETVLLHEAVARLGHRAAARQASERVRVEE